MKRQIVVGDPVKKTLEIQSNGSFIWVRLDDHLEGELPSFNSMQSEVGVSCVCLMYERHS